MAYLAASRLAKVGLAASELAARAIEVRSPPASAAEATEATEMQSNRGISLTLIQINIQQDSATTHAPTRRPLDPKSQPHQPLEATKRRRQGPTSPGLRQLHSHPKPRRLKLQPPSLGVQRVTWLRRRPRKQARGHQPRLSLRASRWRTHQPWRCGVFFGSNQARQVTQEKAELLGSSVCGFNLYDDGQGLVARRSDPRGAVTRNRRGRECPKNSDHSPRVGGKAAPEVGESQCCK